MEMIESEGRDAQVSIPLGGPIYVPNLAGPLTTVAEFEASLLHHLQDLEANLWSDLSQPCDEDISVDELKIYSEEDLVNKAFEEAFKDNNAAENSILEEHSDNVERKNDGRLNDKMSKKRKKMGRKKYHCAGEDGYLEKVNQLAKLKQKQDEDKAAARLHSFSGSCSKINESATSLENHGRMTALRSVGKAKASNVGDPRSVHHPETILCVEVYRNAQTGTKTQEFLVLGRQPLTQLRDSIYCLTDQIMQKAGQHDPSGYFLIEDVFCNDLREPSAIDYSKPIFDWLRNSRDEVGEKWEFIVCGESRRKQKKELLGDVAALEIPQFRAVEMNKTRFCDLRFRLGAGYLYCHQGDCKHTIVIRDMRLMHPEDVQNQAAYPIVTFKVKSCTRKCSVCKIYRATKVTVDDKWAKENPCYFCHNCYYLLHYSEDGLLVYSGFEVYDYHHD